MRANLSHLVCKYILHCPSKKTSIGPAEATSDLPQLQLGRLGATDKLGELVRQSLDAEWVLVDAEDELRAPHLLRRRRCRTQAIVSGGVMLLQHGGPAVETAPAA
jgi:hypothetical protein